MGQQHQDLASEVGDFVIRRADGCWAYQLAVVVDDARQGVSHVVRGEDLADNTPRQIYLQHCLGLPTPSYLHVPLILGDDGEKLSKRHGAAALELGEAATLLRQTALALGLVLTPADLQGAQAELQSHAPPPIGLAPEVAQLLGACILAWRRRWGECAAG